MKLSNLNIYFHSIDVQVSLELAYTEDEIYELSLAREPRDSLSVNIYFRHSSNSSKCLIIIFFYSRNLHLPGHYYWANGQRQDKLIKCKLL